MSLPPGFRFYPTDVELFLYYLKRKVMGKRLHFEAIRVIDLYKFDPWDLPAKSCLQSRDLEWYFFCPRDRKYSNGLRANRATENGYWKTTGKDRPICHNSQTVGMKKTLVFHEGRAAQGQRTNWVMHEYRLEDKALVAAGVIKATVQFSCCFCNVHHFLHFFPSFFYFHLLLFPFMYINLALLFHILFQDKGPEGDISHGNEAAMCNVADCSGRKAGERGILYVQEAPARGEQKNALHFLLESIPARPASAAEYPSPTNGGKRLRSGSIYGGSSIHIEEAEVTVKCGCTRTFCLTNWGSFIAQCCGCNVLRKESLKMAATCCSGSGSGGFLLLFFFGVVSARIFGSFYFLW
ncbi:uncharacterized protein LOC122667280 [Telopea speciosissima]|uniref:uncharacterized protein LOC122667280 n=1 Tax=Telopea speciosissima TaxID=54955 RepID=UPI001CC651B7|nr:uncharacterized protein LOC122667280 [Telopea speciosissima]